MDNADLKADMRSQVLDRRSMLRDDARELANRQVFERAHKLDVFQLASCVHIYRSVRDEVDTWPFFEYAWGIGKRVYVPVSTPTGLQHTHVTRDTQWQVGAFGIPEPRHAPQAQTPSQSAPFADVLPADLTLVIVPLVAFDKACNRVGYGKGFYDRFLATAKVMTMGLAFECQKVDVVPTEQHDVALSCVATDQRWYIP